MKQDLVNLCLLFPSITILLIFFLVNYPYVYRLNWTSLIPITMMNWEMKWFPILLLTSRFLAVSSNGMSGLFSGVSLCCEKIQSHASVWFSFPSNWIQPDHNFGIQDHLLVNNIRSKIHISSSHSQIIQVGDYFCK